MSIESKTVNTTLRLIKLSISMTHMYCNNCKQNIGAKAEVGPKRQILFLLLLFLGFIPGIIYAIHIYTSLKFKTCPICLGKNLDSSKTP
jgi:hypothetical protein